MAVTNAMIVAEQKQRLLNEGKIKPTGRVFEVTTNKGVKMIPETEEIHTYQTWKALGYQVIKGQKAVAKFPIWKYTEKDVKDEDGNDGKVKTSMFMKNAAWFSRSQVEEVAR